VGRGEGDGTTDCGAPAVFGQDLRADVSLIRPLSAVSRTALLEFLTTIGQEFRTDVTNRDPAFTRNRIRHAVLPFLREQLNPRVDEALLRLSAQATAVQQTLETLADRLLAAALLEQHPDGVRLDCDVLSDQPPGLIREMFSRLWQHQGWPRRNMSFEHFEKLTQLATTRESTEHSLPGSLQAKRRRDVIEIERRFAGPFTHAAPRPGTPQHGTAATEAGLTQRRQDAKERM
jgi:tRNA(Ile)-lysidine synthase